MAVAVSCTVKTLGISTDFVAENFRTEVHKGTAEGILIIVEGIAYLRRVIIGLPI